jgi:hypothetical protein
MIYILAKYNYNYQDEEDEVGKACRTHGAIEESGH